MAPIRGSDTTYGLNAAIDRTGQLWIGVDAANRTDPNVCRFSGELELMESIPAPVNAWIAMISVDLESRPLLLFMAKDYRKSVIVRYDRASQQWVELCQEDHAWPVHVASHGDRVVVAYRSPPGGWFSRVWMRCSARMVPV